MPLQLRTLLSLLIYAVIILVVVEAVISNLIAFGKGPSSYHPAVRMIRSIVNPMLDPIRRLIPTSKTGGLDISPMLLIFALSIVRTMINGLH